MLSELVIIVLLTLANGLFSGTEIAILSVRKTRLRELIEGGRDSARAVEALRMNAERFLATVQVGITVIGATAAAYGGASISARLEPMLRSFGLGDRSPQLAFAIVVALVSYLSIVLGELVPKSLALRYSERYSLAMGRPMRALSWLMRPAVWFLTFSSNLVLRLFGDSTSFTEARLSAGELQEMVEEATRVGSVHPRTGEIASRAFDFAELSVTDVMVPRPQVRGLPRRASVGEIRDILLEGAHARMPVFDGAPDNVVGYVVAKDLLAVAFTSGLVILEDAIRPAYFVPERTRAIDVLQAMQQKRTLMAVVVDEIGGLAGIVTMEDLLEELVGEIFSEHETPPELVTRDQDGSAMVQAVLPIRDVNRALAIELPESEDYNTLGGLCAWLAGEIPQKGRKLRSPDGSELEVLDASPRRVKLVRVRPATS